jgi:hypothetical protein
MARLARRRPSELTRLHPPTFDSLGVAATTADDGGSGREK